MRSYYGLSQPKKTPWNAADWVAFIIFLIWRAAGLYFTVKHITPAVVARWHAPDWQRQFVDLCLQNGDPILILLAFISTHLQAARQWSAGIARRWAAIVLVCAFAIETYGANTGLPFGAYHYTDNFGPMIWIVPLTIPLAWHVVVTNALFVVRALTPNIGQFTEAGLVGLICMGYDFVLEPFATVTKNYWVWDEGSAPPINYLSWFAISALLVRIFGPTISTNNRLDLRPIFILGITLAIFLAGRFS
jgi:uncharacterized membrane protein